MTALADLLADGLLLVSLLSSRPLGARSWAPLLALHAGLLAAALAAAACGGAGWLAVAGLVAALAQLGLHLLMGRRAQDRSPRRRGRPGDVLWLLGGLLLVALSRLLLPGPALFVPLALLLVGLLAALAQTDVRGDATDRAAGYLGGMLLAGDGLTLAACRWPGGGWVGFGSVLALQAGLSWLLIDAARAGVAVAGGGTTTDPAA